jgi:RNA polymerase sigma-70 factor (ECF subfamily)
VEARQPREQVSARQREAILDRFVLAVESGDLQSLMDVLAPDIVLITDGGGEKRAALRPIVGAEKVLRFLAGVYQASTRAEIVSVNGGPALRLELDGELEAVATFTFEDDLVTGAYIVRNPHKLAGLDAQEWVLTR